mgnify:CR=1 FL=1
MPAQELQTSETGTTEEKTQKSSGSSSSLDTFITRTTPTVKRNLDHQVARFIYASNSAFRTVEHPQFLKLMHDLRPGYFPPTRKEIGGPLLNYIFEEERSKLCNIVGSEIVCLGFDGWSNIHNEPIVCVTITTSKGDIYLIDTSGNPHTADYLAHVTASSIIKCETETKCKVRSVVTDNAGNVTKMRQILEHNDDLDLITYGCSAHVLNLLSHDFQMPDVTKHVISVVKYFRNNHFANSCLRQCGSSKLVLPSEVRWNSMVDCLESYISNWAHILKTCEENREVIDKVVQQQVSNLSLKRNVEDLISLLKPISSALDKVQRNNCTISESVSVWKELMKNFNDQTSRKKVEKRYNMAITPVHFLAYILDPKEKTTEMDLTSEERNTALNFAGERYPGTSLLALIIKFQAKSSPPFHKAFFEPEVTKVVTAYDWWKSHKSELDKFNDKVFPVIQQLFTAKASSASVERIFSSFGLVHSKLRNRLGTEKASKLVFLFRVFNREADLDDFDV